MGKGKAVVQDKDDNGKVAEVNEVVKHCPFRLWASWMGNKHSFQIKINPKHTCSRKYHLGNAKIKALFDLEGGLVEHYGKLRDYAHEILRSNPGSTVKLAVNPMPDDKVYFNGIYICFKGVKDGWIAGCRKVIGLDGCYLRGPVTGELLSAVGRDANNQIYPIAWGVVNVENKENRKWFVDLFMDDLGTTNGTGLTIISDQHTGLVPAVREIAPNAEHRQCARHIYANFMKRFTSAKFQRLFWHAAMSSVESHILT